MVVVVVVGVRVIRRNRRILLAGLLAGSWRRSTVVERWSLTGELSLSCA